MKKNITAIILTLLLVLGGWYLRPWWIKAFNLSPQHTVDTETEKNYFEKYSDLAVFNNQVVPIPSSITKKQDDAPQIDNVLGSEDLERRIEVDLTNQRLYAYSGDKKVYDFLISSGKWGRTPTGTFRIWIKLRSTKMEGGKKELGTYYYLPNVPFVMYFYNDQIPKWRGFGFHGTYWHNNFGHPMSHGCINMKTEEAELLFHWAKPNLNGKRSIWASQENPGTPITIYGEAPWG